MKIRSFNIRPLLFAAVLALGLNSLNLVVLAETDTTFDNDKAACAKNSSREWSTRLNRCVEKVESKETRHKNEDCSNLSDIEAIKECHKKIAEDKTGLSADPDALPQGSTSKSAIIATAYAMLGMINGLGSNNKGSTCTSKKIMAITAGVGTATDLWMKIQSKKKLDALKNKYQIDVKNNAYDAQIKAFEYLKEEQETVREMAEKEKKRNMLLTLGYGAASVAALIEWFSPTTSPTCYKKEVSAPEAKPTETNPGKEVVSTEEVVPNTTTDAPPPQVGDAAPPSCENGGACTYALPEKKPIETTKLPDETSPKDVQLQSGPPAVKEGPTTPPSPKADKFVMTKDKNGIVHIKSTDGTRAIVGDRVINNRTGVAEPLPLSQQNIVITRINSDVAIPQDSRIGIYSSPATDNANKINFTNSGSTPRTQVNNTSTIINDGQLGKPKPSSRITKPKPGAK